MPDSALQLPVMLLGMSDLKKDPMGAKEEKVTWVKDNRTEQLDEQQL